MNNNQLATINQNAKSALIKSKNLLDITKKLLDKKELVNVFEFKPFLMEKRHTNSVRSVAISSDGKYIVSRSNDNTIKIWDFKTGECLKTLEVHSDYIISIKISPDGKYIVAGLKYYKDLHRETEIKIWDIKTGECLNTFEVHLDYVNSVTISPDGKYIAYGNRFFVIIMDIKTGKNVNSFRTFLDGLSSIAISPDSKYIVVAGVQIDQDEDEDENIEYGIILILDFETKKQLNYLICGDVRSVAISLNGKYIISSITHCLYDEGRGDNNYSRVNIIDIETGEYLNTFTGINEKFISSEIITPDEKYIILGSVDKTIKICDIKTGEHLTTLKGHSNSVSSIAVYGGYIISGSEDETIKIWDIKTNKNIYNIDNCYNISIDNNGYFSGSDDDIDKYLRISEEQLTQRKLTHEEINHFRKKDSFLE